MTIRGFVIIGTNNSEDLTWLQFQRYYNLIQNGVAPKNYVEDATAVDFQALSALDRKFDTEGDQFLNRNGVKVNKVVRRSDINLSHMSSK